MNELVYYLINDSCFSSDKGNTQITLALQLMEAGLDVVITDPDCTQYIRKLMMTEKFIICPKARSKFHYLGVGYTLYIQNRIRMNVTFFYSFFYTAFAYKVHYG